MSIQPSSPDIIVPSNTKLFSDSAHAQGRRSNHRSEKRPRVQHQIFASAREWTALILKVTSAAPRELTTSHALGAAGYRLLEVAPSDPYAARLEEIAERLKGATRASESLAELSGMAGLLIVDGLRGGHEAAARAWIVEILGSEGAHKDHVEAVADALVNHLVPLWDEARAALKGRLSAGDKYTFMSALTPLLFDAPSLDDGLEALRAQIPAERMALAERLVKKIKQAGAPR